jgi:hypothetical protein
MADFNSETRRPRIGFIPNTPFGHGKLLMDTDDEPVQTYQGIVGKSAVLANVKDDKLLKCYQKDQQLLTHILDMARRENTLRHTFWILYYGWTGSLLLTRAKNGMERKLQASIGANYTPGDTMDGFGEDYFSDGVQEGGGNPLKDAYNSIKNRKKSQMWTGGQGAGQSRWGSV